MFQQSNSLSTSRNSTNTYSSSGVRYIDPHISGVKPFVHINVPRSFLQFQTNTWSSSYNTSITKPFKDMTRTEALVLLNQYITDFNMDAINYLYAISPKKNIAESERTLFNMLDTFRQKYCSR